MIGAQAYYRNCGFVHFIWEEKENEMQNKLKFRHHVAGIGAAIVVLCLLSLFYRYI